MTLEKILEKKVFPIITILFILMLVKDKSTAVQTTVFFTFIASYMAGYYSK